MAKPDLRTYRLFISHGWKFTNDYYRMSDYLEKISEANPQFNYEVRSDPSYSIKEHRQPEELMTDLRNQIRASECVIIVADMYHDFKYWLDYAMDVAQKHDIPVIGVRCWNEIPTPVQIKSRVNEMADWDTKSIFTAIKNQCRFEIEY